MAPTKKVGKSVWKSFAANEYQQAAVEMVHFSAKAVHSKTRHFGIRLGAEIRLDLPYVAASLMERSAIPLDHIQSAGSKKAVIAKQINAVRHKKLDQFKEVPQIDIDAIDTCNAILDLTYQPKGSVGIRLRQIILQDVNGNDIAATPLPCGGLSALINTRVMEECDRENPADKKGYRKNEKGFIKRKHTYLDIGGTESQNVGLNVYEMREPLMFMAPSMDKKTREIKQAWAAYYNGITIKPNIEILRDFIIWQENLLSQHFKIRPSDLQIRNEEAEFLAALTNDFMGQVEVVEELLHANMEKLPDKKMCSPDLPFIQQALFDRALRTMEWRREFSCEFHSQIIGTLVWINNRKKGLQGSIHETVGWIGIIEEALE